MSGVNFQVREPATPPSGTTIKTTKVSGEHIQHVLLDDGTGTDLVETRANTGAKALTVAIGPTDPISDVPVVLEFDHHQVHEGESHGYSYLISSMNSGSSQDFRINVPATLTTIGELPHMVIEAISTAEAEVYLYEGMTYTEGNGGTAQTSYNRNRASTTEAATKIYLTPTPATTGDNLWIALIGSGNRAGSASRSLTEWVLQTDTDYLVRVTSRAAACKICVRLEWYEDLGV